MLHRRPVERWARAGATATDTRQVRAPGATDSARSFGRLSDATVGDATVGPLTGSSEPAIHRIAQPADELESDALHSESASALLAELRAIPGGRLCVRCASVRLHVAPDSVLNHIRKLVTTGEVICGRFRCSSCRGMGFVAFLRPFGYPPQVA